jgi:Acyl-CoA thioesterase
VPNKKGIKSTLELFNLDRIDRDVFQGKGQNFGGQRIYGGEVMAQGFMAAKDTVEAVHQAHASHANF